MKKIIRYIKKAIREHQLSFMIYALPSWAKNNDRQLYEWFDMVYQCVREHKATEYEVRTAYRIFKEILEYFKEKTMWELTYWIDYGTI